MEGPPGTVRTAEICVFIPYQGVGLVTGIQERHIAAIGTDSSGRWSAGHMPLSRLYSLPVGSAPRRWSGNSKPPLRQGCSQGNGMQRSGTSGRRRSCLRGLSGNQSNRSRLRLRTMEREREEGSKNGYATLLGHYCAGVKHRRTCSFCLQRISLGR
jgi:hypothetical protein